MPVTREAFTFPTRSYPYRHSPALGGPAADPDPAAEVALQQGRLYRFVLGLDRVPRPIEDAEAATLLGDPFAELLLKRGRFPPSLDELLAALDDVADDPAGLPEQQCFLVADGGQIAWTPATADLNRQMRFVLARARDGDTRLLISSSTVSNSTSQFIQLVAWDEGNGVYNYYERRGGTWLWAGNSRHALAPETRGRGPFDSHVNGSLVMKELRQPWNGWHGMNASIQDTVLAPEDPLRTAPLFRDRVSAHELETSVVRPGVERWNRARIAAATASGSEFTDVRYFMRQILDTTTVNLASSSQQSDQLDDNATLTLPATFFLNVEALLDAIGLAPNIDNVVVPGRLYRQSLRRYDFTLTDGSYRQPGDSFFAFLIPEPAFEDLNVLALLLRQRIISRRFAACLLMVDFPNPIFSERRRRLLAHVPDAAPLTDRAGGPARTDLEARFVAAVEASGQPANSPEEEFLANWRLPAASWQRTFEARVEDYFGQLTGLADSNAGFDGWVRLAESRRREFRRRPLAEFRLTLPTTSIPRDAPTLAMRPDGTVQPRP